MNKVNNSELINPKTRGDFRRATESAQRQSRDAESESERLLPIWAGLADAYGSAFTSQFGDEPNASWIGGLSEYSTEQITAAVGGLIKAGDSYAPNLATVIGAIESANDWRHKRQSRSLEQIRQEEVIDHGEGKLLLADPDDRTPEQIMADMRALFTTQGN